MVLSVASDSSVSIKFRSCENRFVTIPVSVLVKNRSGAWINVRKASWWRLAPARFTAITKSASPTTDRDIKQHIWKVAYMLA